MQERTATEIANGDPELKEAIQKKIKEIENHFESNLNIIKKKPVRHTVSVEPTTQAS